MFENCKTETEKKLLGTLINVKGGLETIRCLPSLSVIPVVDVLIKELEKTLEDCREYVN